MWWQQASQHAVNAEDYGWPSPFRRQETRNGEVVGVVPPNTGTPPREPNRLLEIHGLMGAIGEQLGLAYTVERDVQRFVGTADVRSVEYQTLIQRALAESAAYFTLGASHTLGNLVLRLLMLNERAAAMLVGAAGKRGEHFRPLSDNRFDWVTLSPYWSDAMIKAAAASGNEGMVAAVKAITDLRAGSGFQALDDRRGMDYHRRRPQSVRHTSPRKQAVESTRAGVWSFTSFGPQAEPEADADLVHQIVKDALAALLTAMQGVRRAVPEAIRAEGINYITDYAMGEPG